ncbi:MAG TPA: hypothetical protein VMV46_09490 [Thermoanaerobaculia bacterium]|nr:hypothetical protein [Thermoanaerobaculia bacterium]
MSSSERFREVLTEPLTAERLRRRVDEGWRPVAVEWERTSAAGATSVLARSEVPYGLQVAADASHLEENPAEVETMMVVLDLIAEDQPLSRIAADLNRHGLPTRSGQPWTQTALFHLLPRLIEAAPEIYASAEWGRLRRARRDRGLRSA